MINLNFYHYFVHHPTTDQGMTRPKMCGRTWDAHSQAFCGRTYNFWCLCERFL